MARRKRIDPETLYAVEFDRKTELDMGRSGVKTFYPGQVVWLKGKWLEKLLPGEGVRTWRES